MSHKKLALLLACCAAAGSSWSCSESNDNPTPNEICSALENGKKFCRNGGAYQCVNERLVLLQMCDGTAKPFCDSETFTCVTYNLCSGNQAKCENNTLMLCQDGAWKVLDQCLNMVCDASTRTCKLPPSVCTPGCTNSILTTCVNNKASTTSCPNGCNATGTACEETTSCTPGCANNILTECTGGIASTTTCANGCNDTGTACAPDDQPECTAGVTRCEQDILYTCVGGTWNAGEPCPQGEACGTDDDDNDACVTNITEITTCKPYTDSNTSILLENGESTCVGFKAISCQVPENATEIPAVGVVDCDELEDHYCSNETGTAKCVEDLETPCTYGDTKLAHGASACANNDIISCQDGSLNTVECDDNAPCAEVNGKFECYKVNVADCEAPNGSGFITTGSGVCAENVYKICQNGVLSDETTCSGDTPICDIQADSHCRAYKNCSDSLVHGAVLCNQDNTEIVTCTDGIQTSIEICQPPASCVIQNDTPACVSSAPKYTTIKAMKDAYDAVVAAGTQGLSCDIEVTGVVTASRGSGATIFFQDGSSVASNQAAGIYIYNSTKDLGSFNIGDNVKVTASELLIYNGQLEIVNASVAKTDATDTVIPAEINDISDILETTAEAKNPYNLMLVTLKNVTTEDGKTIKDAGNHSINVSTYIAKNLIKADTTFKYDITGIVNFNKSANNTVEAANGLAPRSQDDIVAVGCINSEHIFTAATENAAAKCEATQIGDKFCSAEETSYACKTIDDHAWRVVCENGTSKPGEMGTVDCTALGQICVEASSDAYCAACSETDVSLCTETIPAHAKHICEMGFVPACGWECETGYVLNAQKDGCVPEDKCTTNVCDGDMIRICNTQTGLLSAAQACTGNDTHGVYACSNNICSLSGCTNGYYKEGDSCVAKCTADVCDGDKIKACNAQTGVLSTAQACTGSDTHGVYTCSNNICGLSGCANGYHKEGNACVANCTTNVCDGDKIKVCDKQSGILSAAQSCTGSDTHGVYTCSNNICGLSGCANGYHKEGNACVANCTADVCDGDKIKLCNKQTGVLSAAQACTGSDAHGVYTCSNNICGLSGCANGYHKEGNACVANCTTDVCDGKQIRSCNKQTGILSAAADCNGPDAHGIYACSNNICSLSECLGGYHKEGSACVKDPEATCNGTNWISSATYTVPHEGLGCSDAHDYFICQDGDNTSLTDTCGNKYCNPDSNDNQTICVECLNDSHCADLNDPIEHVTGVCAALACEFKCETAYAFDKSSACKQLAASFRAIDQNNKAYAQINQLDFPNNTIQNPRFICTTDRSKSISAWTELSTTVNEGYDNQGGVNVEYMADLSALNNTNYCTFLFDVDGTTYIAPKEEIDNWRPTAATADYIFPNETPLFQYTGNNGGETPKANVVTMTGWVNNNQTGYTNSHNSEVFEDGSSATLTGAFYLSDHVIDGITLIMKGDKNTSIVINNLGKGIGTLAFDYQTWNSKEANITLDISDGTTTVQHTITKANLDTAKYSYDFNNSKATTVTIKPADNSSAGRVLIDNISWTSAN